MHIFFESAITQHFTHNGYSIFILIFLRTGSEFFCTLLSSHEVIEFVSRRALRDHLVQPFHWYIFGFHCEGILGILAQGQNDLVKGESAKSA